MSDLIAEVKALATALDQAHAAGRRLRYHFAVQRDNRLTQAELIPYIESLIWAEQRNTPDDDHA